MTRQCTRWLLHLYPAGWRERYGEEFDALLEQRPLHLGDVADVVRSVLDARLHAHRGRNLMQNTVIRLAGLSLFLAGSLWILGTINRYGYLLPSGQLPSVSAPMIPSDVMRGYIPLLLLVGLAGVWYRSRANGRGGALETVAFIGVEAGLAAYGLAWAVQRVLGVPWYTSALRHDAIALGTGCLCLGVLCAGIALFHRRALPGWAVFPLAVGMLGFLGLVVAIFASDPTTTNDMIYHGQVYVYLAFGLAWLPLGLTLLVFGRRYGGNGRSRLLTEGSIVAMED